MIDRTRYARRSRHLILGLVMLASYAYFYEGGGWNQNSRFDLVRAIIQRSTLRHLAPLSVLAMRAKQVFVS
jgi:hypothetical protein